MKKLFQNNFLRTIILGKKLKINLIFFLVTLCLSLIIACGGSGGDSSTVATPTYNINGGVYPNDINVEIICETEGATIYYTIDGTEPTITSTEYTSAISIAGDGNSKTIKAIAFKEGMNNSDIISEIYIIEYESTWSFDYEGNTVIPNDNFYNPANWIINAQNELGDNGSVSSDGTSLQLNWEFGIGNRYKYVQCYQILPGPISLSADDIFTIDFKGSDIEANVRFKLKFEDGSVHSYKEWENLAKLYRWGEKIAVLKKEFINSDTIDWSNITVISIEVYAPASDENVALENGTINVKNLISSSIVNWEKASEQEFINHVQYSQIKTNAINALINRQTTTGLLITWDEDSTSWLYGQGLGLKTLCLEGNWNESNSSAQAAEKLALFLANNQMSTGYWPRTWNAYTGEIINEVESNNTIWMGDAPWPLIGLQCYYKKTSDERVRPAIEKGLQFIKSLINENGQLFTLNIEDSLLYEVTSCEAYAAVILSLYESNEIALADKMWDYILSNGWDSDLGLWKEAINSNRPVLFANTWLAHFLIKKGNIQMANDSLATIGKILHTRGPSAPWGLDGIVPLAVWYEGTLSYICAGGPGSKILFEDLKEYINDDGTVCHYNDNLDNIGGIWAVDWHSLDGTSWLYYAASGKTPFENMDGEPVN